jgi:arylformamidase
MSSLVDLTLPLRPGMRGVNSEPAFTVARDGWNAANWHLYSHAGTHMDAQIHFEAGHESIDTKSLAQCCGPAWVVNLVPVKPRALLTVASLGGIAEKFLDGESLLLRTDWHRHVDDPALYRDALPRIGEDLARWCVARKVRMLGVEPPSIADVNNRAEVTAIHQILLAGGVTIVEGLACLDRLNHARVTFFAVPLKLAGADGSPVRAFAFDEPPENPLHFV